MPFAAPSMHKVAALVASVAVTLAVQGSMLASFDNLAVAAPAANSASCTATAITLPTVEVVHARS
jgi:hypothetical protein